MDYYIIYCILYNRWIIIYCILYKRWIIICLLLERPFGGFARCHTADRERKIQWHRTEAPKSVLLFCLITTVCISTGAIKKLFKGHFQS